MNPQTRPTQPQMESERGMLVLLFVITVASLVAMFIAT